MDLVEHFHRLFEYDGWANQEVLVALRKAAPPPAKSVRIAAHIVATEWLWLNRLLREPQQFPVWPEFNPNESASHFEALPGRWQRYVEEKSDRLSDNVDYLNSKGESWTSTIHDVLTHVVIHSGYHRGQIATDFRAAGFDPPYTDYIHATRQNLLRG